MKRLAQLALFLLFASSAFAQTQTLVSGTLTDPNGVAYYPATVIACLSPSTLNPTVGGRAVNPNPGANYCVGPTNTAPNGSFSMALWPNANIVPGSTTWIFTVQAAGTAPPAGNGTLNFSSAGVTISGATQDVSTNINSAGTAQLRAGGISFVAQYNKTSDFFSGSSLSANWTVYLNGFTVSGGTVTGTSATQLNVAALTGVPANNNAQYMSAVIGTLGTGGPAVRINGTPTSNVNFYVCTETSTQLIIQRVVGASNGSTGTTTNIATVGITGLAGDRVTLSVVGSDLNCQRNGSSNSPLQVHDTAITTGAPGISLFQNVGTLVQAQFVNPAPPSTASVFIVADGDSITAANGNGSNNTDPYTNYLQTVSSNAYVANLGVSSKCLGVVCSTFDSMLTTGTSVTDTLCLAGAKNIVVIMGGTNDIANAARTPAQVYADLTTYVANRKAAAGCNWKVVVVPQVSRGNANATDQSIQALNALIYRNAAGADAVVDLTPTLTTNGASGNAALFNGDFVHPTELTHIDILAKAISLAVSKL